MASNGLGPAGTSQFVLVGPGGSMSESNRHGSAHSRNAVSDGPSQGLCLSGWTASGAPATPKVCAFLWVVTINMRETGRPTC